MDTSGTNVAKWRRFWRNPRAAFSAVMLGIVFIGSLIGNFFLPPPGEIVDPATIEPCRRITVRIVPERRAGRLDLSPSFTVSNQTGCETFSGALTNGAPLADAIGVPDGLREAVGRRFDNLDSPASSFTVVLPDGTTAEISLAAFKPRETPPRTVRLRLRDSDRTAEARTIVCTISRNAVKDIKDPKGLKGLNDFKDLGDDQLAAAQMSLEPVAWPFRPVPGHPCGIDSAGRDVLSRIVAGTRIAMLFGLLLVASSAVLGIAIGALQGYFGGRVDLLAQRFTEIWSALPFLYVMMLVGSVFGRSFGLLLFCYGLFNWIGISYYMRAEFLRLRSRPFVDAAKCQGLSSWSIAVHHILPNALTPLITLLPFCLIGAIASISALDFLGFGLPPLTPSLGELLGQSQQNTSAWWLALYPALVLFAIMLFAVFVGEGLRDAFDPKPTARYG